MTRLYANWLSERRKWCIDQGPGTKRRTFRTVAVEAPGVTKAQRKRKRDDRDPSMWIEFSMVSVASLGERAVIR